MRVNVVIALTVFGWALLQTAATPAYASTLSRSGNVYTYSGAGDGVANQLMVTTVLAEAPDPVDAIFTDNTAITLALGTGCTHTMPTQVRCDDEQGIERVIGIAGAGNDSLSMVPI